LFAQPAMNRTCFFDFDGTILASVSNARFAHGAGNVLAQVCSTQRDKLG
jgi:hypothetical protein